MLQPKFDICPWRNYFFSLFSMCNSGHTIILINIFPCLWKSINMPMFSQIYEHLHDSQLCHPVVLSFFSWSALYQRLTGSYGWCNQEKKKKAELENVTMSDAVSGMKRAMLQKNDGWLVTRGLRPGQRGSWGSGKQTHNMSTHSQWPPSNCRTLDTNTHSCQGQTKIIHKTPTPPPLGVTDTVSPSCTHTRMELPGGSMLSMWPVESHYSAVQTKEPRVNFLFECSGFLFSMAPTPTERSPNSSWKLFCMFS